MKTYIVALFCLIILSACGKDPSSAPQDLAESSALVQGKIPDPSQPGFASTVFLFKNDKFFCTGSMITNRLVLTAAHCVERTVSTDWEVAFAMAPEERRGVIGLRIHEFYGSSKYLQGDGIMRGDLRNDIAMMALDDEPPVEVGVAVVATEPLAVRTKDIFTVYGAGRTGMFNKDAGILRTAQIEGQVEVGDSAKKISFDQRQGAGLCQGDSGGPIFQNQHSKLILVGLTSGADRWKMEGDKIEGDICRYFGVATQVGLHFEWITETTRLLNQRIEKQDQTK